MNCPSCGAPIRVGAGFCGNCGAKLEVIASSVAAPVFAPVQSPPLAPPPPPPPSQGQIPPTPPAPSYSPPPPPPIVHADPQVVPPVAPPVVPPVPSFAAPTVVPPVAPPVFSIQAPPAVPSTPVEDSAPLAAVTITPPPELLDAAQQSAPLVPAEEDLDATVVSARRRPRLTWRLVLPDGEPYAIESTLLIGRGVKPRAKWPSAQLLSVDDPTKSVSKTHAVLEADAEQLWITDLKSTNGVVVTSPDGQESDGDDGGRVSVQPGSTITLGKYVIQVEKD